MVFIFPFQVQERPPLLVVEREDARQLGDERVRVELARLYLSEPRSKQKFPALKVLLTTGYAEESMPRTDLGGREFEVINKPYSRVENTRKVRRILDGPTGIS